MPGEEVEIRPCHAVAEFEQMVELESKVWSFDDGDLVPSQMYVVAAKIGGQAIGAFAGRKMVGFVLAYPGIRDGKAYLHSHMAAVLPEFRELGIGRRLKLAQREDALSRGISQIEWTFDPLQAKNAYFNICRLGAVAGTYLGDFYGATTSPLHAGLPTDRLLAEWRLRSDRVKNILRGIQPAKAKISERVEIVLEGPLSGAIAAAQSHARQRFQELFARGYVVTWFERNAQGGAYVLEPSPVSGV